MAYSYGNPCRREPFQHDMTTERLLSNKQPKPVRGFDLGVPVCSFSIECLNVS